MNGNEKLMKKIKLNFLQRDLLRALRGKLSQFLQSALREKYKNLVNEIK